MDSPWVVRILCSRDEDYCLAVRGHKVVVTFADHRDKFQYWIKDEKQSTEGEEGRGSSMFALVNYATGLAIQNCAREKDLPLVDYTHKADPSDETNAAVWTISNNTDHKGFYCICRADDMSLLIVVWIGDRLHDGKPACLETQNGPDGNFRWKFVPSGDTTLQRRSPLPTQRKTVKIFCSEQRSHYMTIHNDTIMLAPSNPGDKYQHWIKETAYCEHVKDETNRKAFALVNKATGKAMGHYLGPYNLVRLVPFNQRYLDPTILWTEGTSNFEGFREIRMLTNISVGLDAFVEGQQLSVLLVGVWKLTRTAGRGNQHWKIEEFN